MESTVPTAGSCSRSAWRAVRRSKLSSSSSAPPWASRTIISRGLVPPARSMLSIPLRISLSRAK
jgi:hypothetical protein